MMFTKKEMDEQGKELDVARGTRMVKSCVRSIVRKNGQVFSKMKPSDRVEWLCLHGLKSSYYPDITSTLCDVKYDLFCETEQ